MDSAKEKYDGAIPIPTTGQIKDRDIRSFERDVLGSIAELPDTIAEMQADPEMFSKVLESPGVKELLSEPTVPSPNEEKPPPPPSPAPEAVATLPGAPAVPHPPPQGPLEVAVPLIASDTDFDTAADAVPRSTPAPALFLPELKFTTVSLHSPISFKSDAGLVTIDNHGLEGVTIGDDSSPFARRLLAATAEFQGPATVKPLEMKDGRTDPKTHSYIVGSDVSTMSDSHNRVVNDVAAMPTRVLVADMIVRSNLSVGAYDPRVLTALQYNRQSGNEEDRGNIPVIDLATSPRPVGTAIVAHDVYMNPELLRFITAGIGLWAYLYKPYDQWLAENVRAGVMDPRAGGYLKEARHMHEREILTPGKHSQSMYPRTGFGPPGATSQDYFSGVMVNEAAADSSDILDRSYSLATQGVSHITSHADGAAIHVSRNGSDFVTKITSVSSESGGEQGRTMAAMSSGGYRRVFTLEEPSPHAHPMVTALAGYAQLLVLDFNLLERETRTTLLSTILSAFYNAVSTTKSMMNPNNVLVARQVDGVREIVSSFLDSRDANPNFQISFTGVPNAYVNAMASGRTAGPNTSVLLAIVLNAAINKTWHTVNLDNRMFRTMFQTMDTPFLPSADAFDKILFGQPAAGQPNIHSTQDYVAEGTVMKDNLIAFANILAMMPGGRGMEEAVTAIVRGRYVLETSMGIITSGAVIASGEPEMYPMGALRAATNGNYASVIDEVILPFNGALSLFVHPLTSSRVLMEGGMFRFDGIPTRSLPSSYSMYRVMERCILNEIVTTLRLNPQGNADIIKHAPEVVAAVKTVMLKYWVASDPASDARVARLLAASDLPGAIPGFPGARATPIILPGIFKVRAAFRPTGVGEAQGKVGDVDTVKMGAAITNINDVPFGVNYERNPSGVLRSLNEAKKKVVTEFYILNAPLDPSVHVGIDGTSRFLYTAEPPANYIDLEDLINFRPTGVSSWNEQSIRALADQYTRATNRQGNAWHAVKVTGVYGSFHFVEETTRDDTVMKNEFNITLKRSTDRHRTDKFEITSIPVYTHVVGDRSQRRGIDFVTENAILHPLMTYTLVPWDTVRKSLVHFEGINLDNPQLYSNDLRGMGNDLGGDSLSRIRARDGLHGTTILGAVRVSTRLEEDFTIVKTLEQRPLPGAY